MAARSGAEFGKGTRASERIIALRIRPSMIQGAGKVIMCERYGSGNLSYRVLVAFNPLSPSDVERIECAVLDAALASLG